MAKNNVGKINDDIYCPKCAKKVSDVEDHFVDRHEEGENIVVECRHCFTIFLITQHYTTYYTVNETEIWDITCGNATCQNNKEGICHHMGSKCEKYKPTDEIIKLYKKDNGIEYTEIDDS